MKQPLIEFKNETDAKNIEQWNMFKGEVKKIFYEKNPYPSLWESSDFLLEKIPPEAIFTTFIDYAFECYHKEKISKLMKMSVYPYKKEGLHIKTMYRNKIRTSDDDTWDEETWSSKSLSEFNHYFIKACKEGFHRDWDKNAICIKDKPEEDDYVPSDFTFSSTEW